MFQTTNQYLNVFEARLRHATGWPCEGLDSGGAWPLDEIFPLVADGNPQTQRPTHPAPGHLQMKSLRKR